MGFKQVTADQLKEMPTGTPVMLDLFQKKVQQRQQVNCVIGTKGRGKKVLIAVGSSTFHDIKDTVGEFFIYEGR